MHAAVGLTDPPAAMCEPAAWMRFRTVNINAQRPLAASDLAFRDTGNRLTGTKTPTGKLDQGVLDAVAVPFPARRTVVLAAVTVDALPSADVEFAQAFDAALNAVNSWLVALGVTHDSRLRPITDGDLPPWIPTTAIALLGDGQVELADGPPIILRDDITVREYSTDELTRTEAMFRHLDEDVPLKTFYELVQRAGAARSAHRHREAVIDYATAGELFLTAMLQQIGDIRAVSTKKLENLRKGPFRDRVDHLCRLLGTEGEPTRAESPVFLWWLHCYRQRNLIVHAGWDSNNVFSEMARIGLANMVVDFRVLCRATAELAHLAPRIQWADRIDETGNDESGLRDPFPTSDQDGS
jgi:hypothetical protein